MRGRFLLGLWMVAAVGLLSSPALAELPAKIDIPHVSPMGREAFEAEYRAAPGSKAFVIGPGGSWAWTRGKGSDEDALEDALERCDRLTSHCVPFAINDKIVFDRAAWATALAPYPDPAADAARKVGWERGQRYFDLALTLPDGTKSSISRLKGRLVVLQFWGSWCPPCRAEMPDFEKLHEKLDSREIVFLMLNYREEGHVGRRWAERQMLKLPIADTGSKGRDDDNLYLADGTAIPYGRAVALAQVPTTMILDRRGLVLFRKSGAADSWVEMEGQIRHAIAHSAR